MCNPQIDASGKAPDFNLVGTRWRHYRTDLIYKITGFTWNGDDDLWMIHHRHAGAPYPYVRSISNFFGEICEGVPRFTKVESHDQETEIHI